MKERGWRIIKKRLNRAVVIALALLLVTLAGCGAQDGGTQAGAQAGPPAPADDFIHVGTIEELMEAIRPQAKIKIEPGHYNLTDFLSEFPNVEAWDAWNDEHEYVQIQDTFDGLEIVIKNVTELTVEGGSDDPADTEIVVEPRYAAVLNFSGCTGIELARLTMGHTDTGDCSGDVLHFDNTKSIYLRSLDLYGCGVYGIGCSDFCGDMHVTDSTIRDCENGPFAIYDGEGDFEFTACTFSGSRGGGVFGSSEASRLSFIACSFGQKESNCWYFDESANFENCEFMEPEYYPDIEPGYEDFYGEYEEYIPAFDPETMEETGFEKIRIENTWWNGYAVVDPQSGDMRYVSDEEVNKYVLLNIGDGTAKLFYGGETEEFSWYYADSASVCLENAEHNLYISPYENADGDLWLLMQYDNRLVWFY